MVAKVLVELSNRNIDKCFTYNVPLELEKNIKVGIRVEVPFGKQYLEGFVLELSSDACDEIELKDIKRLVDNEVILNDELLKLGEYIKDKTLCTLISAYQVMLPKALKAKNNTNINNGLSNEEVEKSREKYGNNCLNKSNSTSFTKKFIEDKKKLIMLFS